MAAITSPLGRTNGKMKAVTRDKRPLAANAVTKKGGLAVALLGGAAKGFYNEAAAAQVGVAVGRFTEAVDNTGGSNGDLSAEVEFFEQRWLFLLLNDTGTAVVVGDRESPCYVLDDQTVTGDDTNALAGLVYDVTSEGVWVEVGKDRHESRTVPVIQTGTSTLVSGTKTITGVDLTASSVILLTMKDPGAGALTTFIALDAPAGSRNTSTGQFVVNAIDNAKAVLTTAVCTFDFLIIG